MRKITLVFEGTPRAVQSARFARIGGFIKSYQPKEVVDWKNYIRLSSQTQLPEGWKPYGKVCHITSAVFAFPPLKSWSAKKLAQMESGPGLIEKTSKPDLTDNLMKGVIDALKGVVFEDDSLISKVDGVIKCYWRKPHIEIEFEGE